VSTPHALCLFDLDGTLIDSEPGVVLSIRRAFEQIGAPVPEADVLRSWIGPSFQHSFPTVLGDDPARTEAAIDAYRDHYLADGWARHTVYPGIAEVIHALAAAGVSLAVVTAKALPQAQKVIASLPFASHFSRIYGPAPDEPASKAGMIAGALADFDTDASATAMIGDRRYDIEGAVANGVSGIGVLWGFGQRRELEAAGASAIAEQPVELLHLLRR
jgi:phosphoglycolate phosphatase